MRLQCSIVIAICFVLSAAFGGTAEDRTVPGPESKDLLKRTAGYIVHTPRSSLIEAVSLPELKVTVVRPLGPPNEYDSPTIHSLSGPDREGHIAYIEDHFFVKDERTRRHL